MTAKKLTAPIIDAQRRKYKNTQLHLHVSHSGYSSPQLQTPEN
jgi:hypothetical protein